MNISRRLAFGSISVATAVVAALIGVYLVSGAVDRSPADATPLQITSSGDDWSGLITMTGTFTAGGNLSGTPSTRFGVCPTCDELFNPGFDTGTSTLDFGELLRAFLFYPLNNPNFFNNNQQQLKVSKIADGADISWPLKLLFRSQDAGKGVNISMTSAEIADIPGAPGRRVVLLDSGGNEIADLRASVFVVPVTIPASTPFELDFTIRVFSPPPLPLGPNLVSPASGDRSNNSTPLFQWQARSTGDFAQYRLRVTTNDLITGPFALNEIIASATTQFQTPGNSLDDGTYLWAVRAETSTGAAVTTFTAPPFVFTVDTTAPSVPTLIRPASGDISNDNLPFFEWTPSTGDVVDYLLQVTSGDINAGPFVINELVAEPGTGHQAVTPLADNTYRWRVIARDAGALNTNPSGSRTFTVDVTPPGPPILAVPGPDQPVPTNTPTFVWVATGVEPVDEYRLQVTSGGSFNPPLDIEVLLSGDTTQFEVPTGDALADAVYQWRVIAGDAALNTASSITQSFRVDTTPPDPPALLLPGSDDLINDNTPFFQWASSPGDVAVFFLKVTSGDINTGPFDIDKPIAAAETSDQTVTPLNDATYRWRVIASDLVGNTSDSGVRLFTVDTTPPSPLPVLGTPANGVSINDKTPFFAWSPVAGLTCPQ